MSWVPKFKLYTKESNFIMNIPCIFYTNAPQTSKKFTAVEGIRGDGCIIVKGSKPSWDLIIRGVLMADDYQALTALIDNLESNISEGTQFILKFEKTPSAQYTYTVMRLIPIEYPENLRTNYTEFQITFKVITP